MVKTMQRPGKEIYSSEGQNRLVYPKNLYKMLSYLTATFVLLFLTVACFSVNSRPPAIVSAAQKEYRRALHWMEQGDLLQAEIFFRSAIAKDSLFSPAYVGLARINLQRGKTIAARRWLDKSLHITGDYLPAYLLRGRLLFRLGEYEAAEKDLKRCRQLLKPGTSKTLKAEVYLLEGCLAGQMLQFVRSAEYYQKVLHLFPGHPSAGKELKRMQEYASCTQGLHNTVKAIILKKKITRADLALLLSARLHFFIDSLASPGDAREIAVEKGWMPLLPDSSFRPNDVVDRAELTLFLTNILMRYGADSLRKSPSRERMFRDVAAVDPLLPFVRLAANYHLLDFIRGSDFSARKPVSGPEAFKSTKRLSEVLKAASLPANRQGQESQ